ncbi:MAG: response regulator [Candidatus Kerfeldbacteria bacterium]|nr:response regulator [Candidatus Kerfeldbacteria bacterium]
MDLSTSTKSSVLVVEDDQFLGELITTKLTKEGFNVHLATNGTEGLDQVQTVKPDIVLLDIIMPEMDGFEVLKNIRSLSDPKVSQTPVIVLSNLGQESNIERALALGANDFLVKSNFTTDEITQKVRGVLAKSS